MAEPTPQVCPGRMERDRRNAELEAKVAALDKRREELESELAKAKKNSGNSSKPPLSDIVNPRPKNKQPGRPKKRKIGGQPGHQRHERTPFPEEELDYHWEWRYEECPCCGGALEDVGEPRVHQQVQVSRWRGGAEGVFGSRPVGGQDQDV